MTAKEFLEQEYQENKATWSLPPVDPKWKKFMIATLEKYHESQLKLLDLHGVTRCSLEGEEIIDDGFGNEWSIRCNECGKNSMEVVRIGKVQCRYCG